MATKSNAYQWVMWNNPRHKRIRREWMPIVNAGLVECARCGEPIEPGTPWDLGHDDWRPGEYAGPEHTWCNRATNVCNTSRKW